mgnify:FL=1
MMPEIYGLWIVSEKGTMIHEQEIYIKDAENFNVVFFGGLMAIISKLLRSENEKDLKKTELDDSTLFGLRVGEKNLHLIVRTNNNAPEEYITALFREILNAYVLHFNGSRFKEEMMKDEKIHFFRNDIEKFIKKKKRIVKGLLEQD